MVKKVYEELIIHVDSEELARLLGLEAGFTLQHIEEVGGVSADRLYGFGHITDFSGPYASQPST